MPGKPNHTHTKYYLDLFFTWRLSVWTKAARSASYFCRYYWWNKSEIWLAEYKGNTKLISSTWNKSDSQDALLEILLLFQHVWSIKPNLIHNKCTSQFLLLDDYLEAKNEQDPSNSEDTTDERILQFNWLWVTKKQRKL